MNKCILLISCLWVSLGFLEVPAQASFQHAVLIGVDGMGVYGIPNAVTPVMDALIHDGVHLTGENVMPTKSGPNWTSLLNGCDSETHKVYHNRWTQRDIKERVLCGGKKGEMIPTIFRVIREAKPDVQTALFHDWPNISHYVERDIATVQAGAKDEDMTTALAVSYIRQFKPVFTFIHLDHVDITGHAEGHKSPPYYQAVEKADSLIGEIIQAYKEAGIYEQTLFVVTSDHGGKGKSHGGNTIDERQIPILISGKGADTHQKIEDARIFDIPATILDALGLSVPECWDGEALAIVFEEK